MLLSAGIQKNQWVIRPADDRVESLARALRISPLVAQVLINRDVTEIDQGNAFLRPKLSELIRPEQMPGIEPAVQRIKYAVENKEKITVYGDYDVDGITGVSILWELLTLLGAEVDYYIPHRIDEGYGLNTDAVPVIAESGTKLIVTVDCGITAVESAEVGPRARPGRDHHRPPPARRVAARRRGDRSSDPRRVVPEPGLGRGDGGLQTGLGHRQ